MGNRKLELIAELLEFLESQDAEELRGEMAPAVGVTEVQVAGLDPDKTKEFEKGFKGALGGGAPAPAPAGAGPMDVLAQNATDPASVMADEEMDEEELMELERLNA